MEESGSEGLDDLIFARKDTFFKDVDYVCISDNYWLGKKKPCITYGLRGICYFFIEVLCCVRHVCGVCSPHPTCSRLVPPEPAGARDVREKLALSTPAPGAEVGGSSGPGSICRQCQPGVG